MRHLEQFCNWECKELICTAILVSPSPVLAELLSQSREGRGRGVGRAFKSSAAGQPKQGAVGFKHMRWHELFLGTHESTV